MQSFEIGDAPTEVPLERAAPDAAPSGMVNFPVRNVSETRRTAWIAIDSEDGAEPGWFVLEGAPSARPHRLEREFEPGASHVIAARLAPPADAPAGAYTFRLRVTAEHDPDADFTLGPSVRFVVPSRAAPPPPPQRPWWPYAAGAAMIALVAGVGFWIWWNSQRVTVPATAEQNPVGAAETLAAEDFHVVFRPLGPGAGDGTSVAQEFLPLSELEVEGTEPAAGQRARRGSDVELFIRIPELALCESIACRFAGEPFLPQAVRELAPHDFHIRFIDAVELDADGRVRANPALLAHLTSEVIPSDITTLKSDEAAAALAQREFDVVFTPVPIQPDGPVITVLRPCDTFDVLSTDPEPGTRHPFGPGHPVEISVATPTAPCDGQSIVEVYAGNVFPPEVAGPLGERGFHRDYKNALAVGDDGRMTMHEEIIAEPSPGARVGGAAAGRLSGADREEIELEELQEPGRTQRR
jgi:hypothetical protein